ncbi:hypothetical protein HYC85_005295 [Camellia sinensis]|uniref:Strictosidine synthase conserved region domain-containing protein n=1 Tax=Camellia sinensis TaxID=4442 RepID=A0A7J7HZ31_CAMSI|nr:hypothetical protein HYC85_005295 [Camellia sinensis]
MLILLHPPPLLKPSGMVFSMAELPFDRSKVGRTILSSALPFTLPYIGFSSVQPMVCLDRTNDSRPGLLKVTSNRTIELLTDEAEDVKFKLTDGVDITKDGMIYFTDASYKYSLKEFIWDILEGRPYGRFISYDPSTKETKVLVRDLYFANGVAISPDQSFVIFCETPMRRCKRYYIQGEKKGDVDTFIDNLPGIPDNIRYDGEGQYWIGLGTTTTLSWDLALRYPFIRKVLAIMERYIGRPHMEINGGFLAVDLEGKPIAHYYDPKLSLVTTGIKIADYLYCGSITYPYIIRLNLTQHPAVAV